MPASGSCSWIRQRERLNAGDLTHRSEILHTYQQLLGGEAGGFKIQFGLLLQFSIAGGPEAHRYYAKVWDNAKASALAQFLHQRLVAARTRKETFVYLCIGDPPSGKRATAQLLESFDAFGAWAGEDVSKSERSKILPAVKQIRALFPRESLPTMPLAKLWEHHTPHVSV